MTLTFKEALKRILESVPTPAVETVSVRKALGRVLAESLIVPRDYPDTRRSAVDGYAVRLGTGATFRLVGVVAAGEIPGFSLEPGECAAVMTGGTVPEGADCVVKVEDCEETNGIVTVRAGLEAGGLINEVGAEATSGIPMAGLGQRIHHALYPTLYYAGMPVVKVFQPPRIGILMTGSELREPEDGPAPGKVFNTNRYIIESFLHTMGLRYEVWPAVSDDEQATRQRLEEMAERCNFVISSGGVSMGRFDYIKKVFNDADFSLLVNRTAIKPGRPLMVAKRKGTLFFGMPGYPAAFLTNTILYLVPALKKACGRIDYAHRPIDAELVTPMVSRKGTLYLNRAYLSLVDGKWTVRNPGAQTTSHFLNFAEVNGLAILPPEVGRLAVGDTVKAFHFDLEIC